MSRPSRYVGVGFFGRHVVELASQQGVLELLEQRALVQPQFRLEPILRIQEDLAGRFPDPVVLHPFPLGAVVAGQLDSVLEVQEGALHEQLHARDRLLDARGEHARGRLDVDQQVGVQILFVSVFVLLRDQVRHQRGTLFFANRVPQRARDDGPALFVVLGFGRKPKLFGLSGANVGSGPAVGLGSRHAEPSDQRERLDQLSQDTAVAPVGREVQCQSCRQGCDVVQQPAGPACQLREERVFRSGRVFQ